ncbi:hypothetical protein [Salininema proteolyticum]|uniref:Uncharacterized protein n=1 Tax=Salininema proteolyticum TaxID=1607685 RepID=A0ABV8U419_9ACTN
MTGRHRRPRRLSHEGRRLVGGGLLAVFFAVVSVYTLNVAIAQVKECDEAVTLHVAAAPEMARVLEGYQLNETLSDRCISLALEGRDSADGPGEAAHVWIPETVLWSDFHAADESAKRWEAYRASVAADPVGIPADGRTVPRPRDVRVGDPRRDTAALLWISTYGVDEDVVRAADDPEAPELVRRTELDDSAGGFHRFDDLSAPWLSYPMLTPGQMDAPVRSAVETLSEELASSSFRTELEDWGFTAPRENPPIYSVTVVDDVLRAWESYER